MSTNIAGVETGSVGVAQVGARLPLLAGVGGLGGGGGSQGIGRLLYARWRPQMEVFLMRAGIAIRDYRAENADWDALAAAVDNGVVEDEQAGIALLLGRAAVSSSSTRTSKVDGQTAEQKIARQRVTDLVSRSRRAYGLLLAAMTDELCALAAGAKVAPGYAYGLWMFLETRFQNTEQDSIGDLWEQFTGLAQNETPRESFEEYKARVDAVYNLLDYAKDKPSAGQYAHRLLWKLVEAYNPAVLALKAGGKLQEAAKVDWNEVLAFMANHERSLQRLNATEYSGEYEGRAMSLRGNARQSRDNGMTGERPQTLADIQCFNCGKYGHLSRSCSNGQRASRNQWKSSRDDEDDDDEGEYEGRVPGKRSGRSAREQVSMVATERQASTLLQVHDSCPGWQGVY